MAREFKLPDIGEGLTEADIVRWLVGEGDEVGVDQPIVEVETDKAVVEIPSPYAGVVLRHGAAEGETLEVGSVLVVIGDVTEPAERKAEGMPEAPEPEPEPEEEPEPEPEEEPEPQKPEGESMVSGAAAAPIVGTLVEEAEELPSRADQITDLVTNVKALPLVRKLARDMGVDITKVRGTGPDGRITREDVLAAAGEGVAVPPPLSLPPLPGDQVRRVPMTRLRRTIAANMARSWAEIPHVTTFDEADGTRLLDARAALSRRHEIKIPVEALVIQAVIPALVAFPEFNASLEGDDLLLRSAADIGIAVDTEDGLLVAVVRDASVMTLVELANEVARLGAGAKERSLDPDELSGQSFTISNIGAVGGGFGTPIVPHGTTAILSVGRAYEKPIAIEGDLAIAPMIPLSLSYDHRVIDGGLGRRFMAMVLENLEEPALFLSR